MCRWFHDIIIRIGTIIATIDASDMTEGTGKLAAMPVTSFTCKPRRWVVSCRTQKRSGFVTGSLLFF
ncbi:MAG: hypothetical protein ACLGQH_01910, partial [Acidobacteriota bacterium]